MHQRLTKLGSQLVYPARIMMLLCTQISIVQLCLGTLNQEWLEHGMADIPQYIVAKHVRAVYVIFYHECTSGACPSVCCR